MNPYPLPLGVRQRQILAEMTSSDRPTWAAELARATGSPRGHIRNTLRALEARGFVEEVPPGSRLDAPRSNPAPRLLQITAAGAAEVARRAGAGALP
ncbi:helix-turn-helix domain-containing protein [Ornithinimicrobium cavernae]|uniref:helix-turn-helix domain-containing protein n=1 Tax=Ornithinimicrobium cavernae TaxID=2666047 RepID=UPI000D68BB7A|nr:helix-turn-helix domain-containing protein [Ornithinimicrobium cavernae]